MQKTRENKGITLIALVITIIVLLILAGVSISLVLGENGVLNKAQDSVKATKDATAREQVSIAWSSIETDYIADKVTKGALATDYFTAEKLNDYLSQGEITKLSYGVNAAGDSELSYKIDDTYYKMIVSGGEVRIEGEPVTTEPEIKEPIENPSPESELSVSSVTIGSDIITKENLGEHLGKAVVYTPANPSTEYGTSTTYRLFYIDFDNDFKDGAGTIYLKADHDNKNVSVNSHTSHSTSDSLVLMKKLNPDWAGKKGTATLTNEKCISWILDPAEWTNWKDITTASVKDKINYVVGAPSLEMYVKSYNTYLSKHSGVYKNDSTTELAENLKCEYTTDSKYYANGYRIGFESVESESWANTGYYIGDNSLFSSEEVNGMYNAGSKKFFWLSSPAAYDSESIMGVDGSYSYVYTAYYEGTNAFCPLVSLKSSVTLSWK